MNIHRALLVSAASLLIATACASNTEPEAGDCPPPRQSNEICPQVVVWAKDPQSGACCEYGTACNAPEGWTTYTSVEECRAAS